MLSREEMKMRRQGRNGEAKRMQHHEIMPTRSRIALLLMVLLDLAFVVPFQTPFGVRSSIPQYIHGDVVLQGGNRFYSSGPLKYGLSLPCAFPFILRPRLSRRAQLVGKLIQCEQVSASLQLQDDATSTTTTTSSRKFFSRLSGIRRFSRLKSWRVENEDDRPIESSDNNDQDNDLAMSNRIRGWFRSSSSSNGNKEGQSDPVKSNFEGLFVGMPGIGDLFQEERGEEELGDQIKGGGQSTTNRKRSSSDSSWFEDERQAILKNYESILAEMMQQLDNQRKEDRESVPENAEAMVRSVLNQEMETEIEETRERLARERWASYEAEQRAQVDEKDVSGEITDTRVRRLVDEGEAEYERQLSAQQQLDEFLRYEAEAFQKATDEAEKKIATPEPNADLDQWALERFEDMALKQEQLDDDDAVLDILYENVADLRERMEKESAKNTRQPETMKEWQVYRAIANRLGATVEQDGRIVPNSDGNSDLTDAEVFRRLQSWKEYNEKEAGVREKGGLSRGPKLPFEWQELESSTKNTHFVERGDRQRRIETRKQINRMSIDALESLLKKSDSSRREKLENEIAYLKRELESKDFLDIDEPLETDVELKRPVDLSDVFSPDQPPEKTVPNPRPMTRSANLNPTTSSIVDFSAPADEVSSRTPPPPKTPFFFSDEEDNADVAETDSKLGTMEDQKLDAMYRRAGARTRGEQERIKAGWEEFKLIEQEKRKSSGLDVEGEGDTVDLTNSTLKYNVSEVMKQGGDIDAEKILSAIGPRPTRTRIKNGEGSPPAGEGPVDPSLQSMIDEKEVESSLYRSVAAAGGGRFKDDPEAKAKDEAKFSEYLQMEKRMREQVDDLPTELLQSSSDVDDDDYAEKVLSELGPRPTPIKRERIDERYLSDTGAVVRDDFDDEDDMEDESIPPPEGSMDDLSSDGAENDRDVPEWVKREQESEKTPRGRFLRGEEIEDAFADTEYEKNMRQLAEYERRRAGKPRQMGIDISDIFGSNREFDDYKDYKFADELYRGGRAGWGGATFESRKLDLLDYTELDVSMINSLLEQRDAVSVTGVSRYMAKINKPFKEFGTIFRLEGVIVDITGLHMEAWSKTADSFGLRQPSIDEVKMASVLRDVQAVSGVFGWASDLSEIQPITMNFREEFNEAFNSWAKDMGLTTPSEASSSPPAPSQKGSLAIDDDLFEQDLTEETPPGWTESELIGCLSQAWTKTADTFNLPWPVQEDILAAASLEPDLAAIEVFGWTTDPMLADEIASFHRRAMQALQEGKKLSDFEYGRKNKRQSSTAEESRTIDKNALMELHFRAWTEVASAFGYDAPTADEVLGAFVLNDPVIVVKSGFGWTDDSEKAREVGEAFTSQLRALIENPEGSVYGEMAQPDPSSSSANDPAGLEHGRNPSFADIVQIHTTGWSVSCQIHGLDPPSVEQVRLSVNMDPRDFIQKVMRWSDDDATIGKISSTFRDGTQEASKDFVDMTSLPQIADSPAEEKTKALPNMSGPSFDDVYGAALAAWKVVATRNALPEPTSDQIMYAMSVGPEEAIRFGFRWSDQTERVSELLGCYMKEVESQRSKWSGIEQKTDESPEVEQPLVQVNPGSVKWIKSLLDVELECGIISHMSRSQVDLLLEFAGIADLIGSDKRVTGSASAGLKPIAPQYFDSQQMLAAALRVERRPDHCVVIDASPGASIAARVVEMQSVAWIGSYPRYELLAADATVNRFEDLTAMNIRRLFGERVLDQPQLDIQQTDFAKDRKIKTKHAWDDE